MASMPSPGVWTGPPTSGLCHQPLMDLSLHPLTRKQGWSGIRIAMEAGRISSLLVPPGESRGEGSHCRGPSGVKKFEGSRRQGSSPSPTASPHGSRFVLNVLQLIPTLDRSGAEKQMVLLAKGLPRDRFRVKVATLTRLGPLEAELHGAGVPVTAIGKRFKLDPLALARLVRFLRAGRFDV